MGVIAVKEDRTLLPPLFRFFFVRILTPILTLFCLTLTAKAQEIISSPHNVGGELWFIGNVTDRANQPLAGLTIEL